jgi:hypothetical protein
MLLIPRLLLATASTASALCLLSPRPGKHEMVMRYESLCFSGREGWREYGIAGTTLSELVLFMDKMHYR